MSENWLHKGTRIEDDFVEMGRFPTREEAEAVVHEIVSGRYDGMKLRTEIIAPYDGCFWEVGFAFVHNGNVVWVNDPREYDRAKPYQQHASLAYVLSEMTRKTEIAEDIECPEFLMKRALYVAEVEGIDFEVLCPDCGQPLDSVDLVYDEGEFMGNGGIGIVPGHPIHSECYALRRIKEEAEM